MCYQFLNNYYIDKNNYMKKNIISLINLKVKILNEKRFI